MRDTVPRNGSVNAICYDWFKMDWCTLTANRHRDERSLFGQIWAVLPSACPKSRIITWMYTEFQNNNCQWFHFIESPTRSTTWIRWKKPLVLCKVPESGRLSFTFSCDWRFNDDFWNFGRAIHLMLGMGRNTTAVVDGSSCFAPSNLSCGGRNKHDPE